MSSAFIEVLCFVWPRVVGKENAIPWKLSLLEAQRLAATVRIGSPIRTSTNAPFVNAVRPSPEV